MALEDQLSDDLAAGSLMRRRKPGGFYGGITGTAADPFQISKPLTSMAPEPASGAGGTAPAAPTPSPSTSAPAAPSGGYNYEQLRNAWMAQTGPQTNESAAAFLKAHPEFATGVSMVGDKWALPGGNPMGDVDVVMASKAGGGYLPQWTDPYASSRAMSAGGGGGGAAAGGTGGSASGGTSRDALSATLADIIAQSRLPVDANDPTIQSQFAPMRQALQRGAERKRASSAERGYAEGMETGALDSEIAGILEEQAQGEAGAIGGLVGNELKARRQQLMQALTLNADMLSDQERMALQRELATLDAQIRREQMGQQNTQFYDQLGADIGWRQATLDRDFYNDITGG